MNWVTQGLHALWGICAWLLFAVIAIATLLAAIVVPGKERRIARWQRQEVLERVQQRLEDNPDKMATRRETAEHPFGTIKAWMGATHFKMRTLKHVATEMALHVLAYNMMRVIAIVGIPELIKAITAFSSWFAAIIASENAARAPQRPCKAI